MKDRSIFAGHLACFAAYAIFGINIIVSKNLMSGHFVSPLGIFTLRSIGAGILFWVLSLFLPKEKIGRVMLSLSFSLYLGMFKPLIQKYSVVSFMKWIFLFSTAMSLPFTFTEVFSFGWTRIPSAQLWELAYLVVCATFLSYYLIPFGQKRIRPTLVSMYSYIQPIIATVISIILGMDILTWQKFLAAGMVFSGIIIVSRSNPSKTCKISKNNLSLHVD